MLLGQQSLIGVGSTLVNSYSNNRQIVNITNKTRLHSILNNSYCNYHLRLKDTLGFRCINIYNCCTYIIKNRYVNLDINCLIDKFNSASLNLRNVCSTYFKWCWSNTFLVLVQLFWYSLFDEEKLLQLQY